MLVSPLAVLLTERILAEWDIAQDAILFREELVDLARIVQSTLDEQKNLLSQATGRKNDEITPFWRGMALAWGIGLAGWMFGWALSG